MARLKVDSLGVTDAGVPGLLDGGEGTEKKKIAGCSREDHKYCVADMWGRE